MASQQMHCLLGNDYTIPAGQRKNKKLAILILSSRLNPFQLQVTHDIRRAIPYTISLKAMVVS